MNEDYPTLYIDLDRQEQKSEEKKNLVAKEEPFKEETEQKVDQDEDITVKKEKKCILCKKVCKKVKRCHKCRSGCYCSRKCRTSHYKDHEKLCGYIQDLEKIKKR